VEQVLRRLHDVHRVRCVADDAPELHAFAYCKIRSPLPAAGGVDIRVDGDTCLVAGGYRALQQALEHWRAADLIVDVSQSLVAL
jgi:hypothetical protein